MEDISLHVLDLAENSIRAGARRVEIRVIEDNERDLLELVIEDDGEGMLPEEAARVADPFFTTKNGKRFGLGVALLEQSTAEADGEMSIESSPGGGARVTARFRLSHPDRKPLGDMAATLLALVTAHPEVRFVYEHDDGEDTTRFDSRETTLR